MGDADGTHGVPVGAVPPLTNDQLADLIPSTAGILEIEGERKKVCMTRAELHEFVQAIRALGVKEDGNV